MILKTKENKYWLSVLLITTLIIGFIIGKFVEVPGFVVDKNINLLHALSIFVTLFVAILISVHFQKNKDINNSANEILINRIHNIVVILDSLHETILEGHIEVLRAPSISKRIYSSLKCVFQSIEDCSIPVTVEFTSLEQKHRLMKELLTNTPAQIDASTSTPVKVEDGKYIYSDGRISEIEQNIEELKNILFSTQLEINKSFLSW